MKWNIGSIEHPKQPEGGRDLSTYESVLGFNRSDLQGKTVLDLGAGPEAKFAKNLEEAGIETNVVELSPDFFSEESREKVKKSYPKVKALAALGQELPFKEEHFDVVVALHLFDHLSREDFLETLIGVIKVLKNGGRAYIGPVGHINANDTVVEINSKLKSVLQNDKLKKILKDQNAEMKIEDIEGYETYPYPGDWGEMIQLKPMRILINKKFKEE